MNLAFSLGKKVVTKFKPTVKVTILKPRAYVKLECIYLKALLGML